MIKKSNGSCELCGEKEDLSVHHLRYNEDAGHDQPEDLIVLCIGCHQKQHKTKLNYNVAKKRNLPYKKREIKMEDGK